MTRRFSSPALLCVLLLTGALLVGCSSSKQPAQQPSQQPSATTEPQAASEQTGLSADATQPAASVAADEVDLDDYGDTEPLMVSDPLEPWNRFWFRFNDVLLLHVLKPVHVGYTEIVPSPLRGGIGQFGYNLMAPVRFLNSLLQGKINQAGVEFGRFIVNSVTSLGFIDVARQSKPLYPYHPETANFGHTLTVWGVPEGIYLVWPFVGPSTMRETVGNIGNGFMSPMGYMVSWPFTFGSGAGFMFNRLDAVYTPYETATRAALEPYVSIRNSYLTLLRQRPL